jgi:hypothetical protein
MTHVRPTDGLFCTLCLQSFTDLLHVSALLSFHLQEAETNISLKPAAINYVTMNVKLCKHTLSGGIDSAGQNL